MEDYELFQEHVMEDYELFQEHVTVDLTDCKYVMEFWKRIRDAFGFQEHFGKNWDAFSDMIEAENPAHKVIVIGANKLPKDWKSGNGIPFPEMMYRILQRNKEFKERYNYKFDYEFIDA